MRKYVSIPNCLNGNEPPLVSTTRTLLEAPSIFIFEFDGVLACGDEAQIENLTERKDEAAQLRAFGKKRCIDLEGRTIPEQRKILYQVAALELNYGIQAGPCLDLAKQATDLGTEVFIFTTRSGLHAVGRMNAFLRDHKIRRLKNVCFFVAHEDFEDEIERVAVRFPYCDVRVFLASDALRKSLRSNVKSIPVPPNPTNLAALSDRVKHVIDCADLSRRENLARRDDLKLALEHGRQIFQYHANQRHTAINYYFVIVAGLVAGLATLYSRPEIWYRRGVGPAIGVGLGIGAIFITVFFRLLEQRNRQLVDGDEELVKRAEKELARLSGLAEFETIVHSDIVEHRRITYRFLVATLLYLLMVLWLAEIALACYLYFNPPGSRDTSEVELQEFHGLIEPQPPPPGVSMRSRSPGRASKRVFAGSFRGRLARTSVLRPGLPGDPPASP